MDHAFHKLCRTVWIGTAQRCLIRITHCWCMTDRALLRQVIRLCVVQVRFDTQYFRDDLPCLSDNDGITEPNVTFRDKVLVVQCGTGDFCSGKLYRIENRYRCDDAGSAHA